MTQDEISKNRIKFIGADPTPRKLSKTSYDWLSHCNALSEHNGRV